MWIEIKKDIFEKSDFKALNYIFQILSWYPVGEEPRYHLFVDVDRLKDTANYQSLKSIESNLDENLEAQFNEFVTEKSAGAKKDFTVTKDKASTYFNIEEAILFFTQPVSLVLENNKNDSYFIRAIIHHFDTSEKTKKHLENGWISFENAGGCTNVKNFVDGFLKRFETLACKNNRNLSDYFRGFILLDSDKEYSTHANNKHDHLVNQLRTMGITHIHILEKRMMENYLPDEVYQEKLQTRGCSPNDKNWIQTYLHLNPEQKDFLNIAVGVTGVQREVNLFQNLSPQQLASLDKGIAIGKTDFPLLFQSPRVNKHSLLSRCNSDELNRILEKINKLI